MPRWPPFCEGCDALVLTFAFFGLRASLLDLCCPLAIANLLASIFAVLQHPSCDPSLLMRATVAARPAGPMLVSANIGNIRRHLRNRKPPPGRPERRLPPSSRFKSSGLLLLLFV